MSFLSAGGGILGTDIHIIDATLREGAQAPGVRFTPEESVEIARGLDAVGVDTIECGHPIVGPAERDRIRAVLEAGLATPVLVHARALRKDVDAAADIGAAWVGIFLGVNDHARRTRVRRPAAELHAMIAAAVEHARKRGLRVRYTLEDASRTETADALEAYGVAVRAGADRLGFADTTGCAEPSHVARCVEAIRADIPDVPIEVHLHDDRGLAVAGTLAAVDAGATWISTAVLGVGERCGIPDLTTVLANLAYRGARAWPPADLLQRLTARVATITGAAPDARRPVIGEHAFTHAARLHVLATARDPASYSWVEAERVGRQVALVPTEPEPDRDARSGKRGEESPPDVHEREGATRSGD